jgi:GTP cyclohydrolase I
MVDVQNRPDNRNIPIDQVGVSDLRYPITVLDRHRGRQDTVANITMTVNLPHHFKGTHMSRFIEVLNAHRGEVTMWTVLHILHDLKERLDAERARVEVDFPYFLEKPAPVSRAPGLMEYQCAFIGESGAGGDDFVLSVKVPVTSLCPCSKALSRYGAHNQRGHITIEVRGCVTARKPEELIWIEELVEVAEASASAPVYSLLKRDDEKVLTEMAYEHPVFVEDIVRNVAQKLMADGRVAWFRVTAVNQESIHNHSAFARVEWQREQEPG